MTAAVVLDRAPVVAAEHERDDLRRIARILEQETSGTATLLGPSDETLELPASAFRLLQRLVHHLAAGQAVTLVAVDKELTTQQAADILNVSRPHLVHLLEQGEIPYTKTGRHRRLRLDDVTAYKQQRDADRRRALRDLTQLNQELGLYR